MDFAFLVFIAFTLILDENIKYQLYIQSIKFIFGDLCFHAARV